MHRIATFRLIPAQQLSQLEERMQAYYAAGPDFPVFDAPFHHPLEWRHVLGKVCRPSVRAGGRQGLLV